MEAFGGETVTSRQREAQLAGRAAVAKMKGVNKDSDLKMGRGSEHAVFQRRLIDGQQVHGKILNIAHHQENANQSQDGVAITQKTRNSKCWSGRGVEKREASGATGGSVI